MATVGGSVAEADAAEGRAGHRDAMDFGARHSALFREILADDASATFQECLPPHLPHDKALGALSLLSVLHTESAKAFHPLLVTTVAHSDDPVLFSCLEGVKPDTSDGLDDALVVSDYLSLPITLSIRIRQHRGLKQFRKAHPGPTALPTTLEEFANHLAEDKSADDSDEALKVSSALRLLINEANNAIASCEPRHVDGKPVITSHGHDTKMAFLRGGWGDDTFTCPELSSDFDSRPHRFSCAYLSGRIASGKPYPTALASGLLCTAAPEMDCGPCSWPSATAAMKGDAAALDLLRSKRFPSFNYLALRCAAEAGHVGILRNFVSSSVAAADEMRGYGGSIALQGAARKGRLEVLRFLIEELAYPRSVIEGKAELLYAAAAAEDCVDALQGLWELGVPWPPSAQDGGRVAVEAAAASGSVGALRWLATQRPPAAMDEQCIIVAAKANKVASLQFLRVGIVAATGGEVHPCPWDERAVMLASMAGSWEAVEWLKRNGAPTE